MQNLRKFRQHIALPVVIVLAAAPLPIGAAQAGMVSTERAVERSYPAETARPAGARDRVLDFIRRENVQKEMETLGVDPAEAYQRVQALSDEEIARIAGRMDAMPAGEGVVGPIVGAAVLVFIILLVTDLMCWTRVFPFTKCVAK